MSSIQAIIYTKPGCHYCELAEALLSHEQADITKHILDDLSQLKSYLGQAVNSFPQIIIDGKLIGGYRQLKDKFDEPILKDNPQRFSPFPIQYHDIWELYKKAVSSFWPVEEILLHKDYEHWQKMTANEQHFIKHVLAFFASADGIIQENLAAAFATEVQIPEARQFFAFQIANESQHAEMYALLIDTYIKDPKEKQLLFKSIQTIPSVQKKAHWALKWLDPQKPFASRLFAFACVEGIQFSGSFAAIFWLKQRGLMPGLAAANNFIVKDEGAHLEHGLALYGHLQNKLTQQEVEAITGEAVDHEIEFLTEAFPCDLIGINCAAMCKYIKHVADRLLQQAGYDSMYNVTHDLDFMELISLTPKENFFEVVSTAYNKHGVVSAPEKQVFDLDSEF